MKRLPPGREIEKEKIHLHRIILALDLISLKFDDILIVGFFEIQSNCESRYSECKFSHQNFEPFFFF